MRNPDDFQVRGARTIDRCEVNVHCIHHIYSPRPADLEIVGVSHGRLEGLTMRRLGSPQQQHAARTYLFTCVCTTTIHNPVGPIVLNKRSLERARYARRRL